MPNPPPRKPIPPAKRPPVKLPDDPNARYRVRDRADDAGNAKVWTPDGGVSLTEAKQLVQYLAAHKKSSTARYEPLPQPVPAPAVDPVEPGVEESAAAPEAEIDFQSMDLAGIITVCGDDPELWAGAFCQITLPQIGAVLANADPDPASEPHLQSQVVTVVAGFLADLIEAVVAVRQRASITEVHVDPDAELEAGRQSALAAARPVARAAQARHDAKKPKVVQPPHKPPPSPLSGKVVDGMVDNEPPEEDQLADDEVHDLLGGVGAAPGATDAKRAAADAEHEKQEALTKAESAYRGVTSKLPGVALPWASMGKLARSQWTYFVTYGGDQPRTVSIDAHRAALTKAEAAYREATEKLSPPAVTWESMNTDAREEWIFFITHGGNVQPAILTAGGAS